MLVGWILLIQWQSCSCSAVDLDEDCVAEDERPVSAAVGLLRANVAGSLVVDAVVDGDIESGALRKASAIDFMSMRPEMVPREKTTYQES